MNIQKIFILILLFVASLNSGFANEVECDEMYNFIIHSKIVDNKVYIEPGSIYVAPDQIFINIEGMMIPVKNLSTDVNGIFVHLDELLESKGKEGKKGWKCVCGRWNENSDHFCYGCHRNRGGQ